MSNNLLDTKTVNLSEIIGNGKKYQVPIFQRDYSWGEGELEDLWLDMIDVYENKITHYMGAIVLQKKEDDTFFLIDGQQRITTLSIFIIAIVEFLEQLANKGIDELQNKERANIIKRNFIGDKDATSLMYSSKLFLNDNNDHFYQSNLVNFNKPIGKLTDSQNLIWESYEYFVKKIQDYFNNSGGAKISEFLEKNIAKNMMFIQITVEDDLSAYTVFETLNSRGVGLTTTDLLKNFLFSKVANSPTDLNLIKNNWAVIISIIGLKEFPTFLRYYINSKFNLISQKQLYKFIKRQILEKNDVVKLLNDLKKNAIIYIALGNPQDDEWKKSSDYKIIEKYLGELKLFQVKLAKSLLIAGYNNFSEKEFIKLLNLTSVVSFRYNVIGNKDAKKMEIEYNKISQKISIKQVKNTREVFEIIKNKLYVSDSEFKDIFKNKQIKIAKRKLIKYILLNLQNNLNNSNLDYNSDNSTIEHILPQNPEESWNDDFPDNIRDSFVSRLGNYLLLEPNYNKQVENKSFNDKLKIYSNSKYFVTNAIQDYYSETGWNPSTIDKLQSFYAQKAKDTWRLDF